MGRVVGEGSGGRFEYIHTTATSATTAAAAAEGACAGNEPKSTHTITNTTKSKRRRRPDSLQLLRVLCVHPMLPRMLCMEGLHRMLTHARVVRVV